MVSSNQFEQVRPRNFDDIEYKIADTWEERLSAFRLVYHSYLRAGLGQPNPHGVRVTPYHLLPTTEVFIARLDETTIFTMTLVIDGELGLPMESVYPDVVESIRTQGLAAEISCLADRRANIERFFPVFLKCSVLLAQYAWKRGVEHLLAAVHPRHARFYRRFLNFDYIGEEKSYPTVRGNPAVPLGIALDGLESRHPSVYERYFGQWLPDEVLQPKPLSADERRALATMVDPSFRLAPITEMGGTTRKVAATAGD